ncbi:hypothetical protein LINGRAHAP2_LOCUS37315 [Linum grandiflorum]
MNFTRIQNHSCCCRPLISQFYKLPSLLHHFPETLRFPAPQRFSLITSPTHFPLPSISRINASVVDLQQEDGGNDEMDYLAPDGPVYRNTLRLVECSMFAAVTGLVYFLSNSLSIENYFGWFFPLPIVISSLRWGVAAGRKTMLTHAAVGLTMGSLWRLQASWTVSIFWCTIARATGAIGYVLTSSFLIRENILALITVNIHASLSYVFAAIGINTIPSMNFIYTLFGTLVVINSLFSVFLLHLLHSVFLTRLGMRHLLRVPAWFDRAL